MSQSTGPRLCYGGEDVVACMVDRGHFSLKHRFSTVEDSDERRWQLREFCTPLLEAVQLPDKHFAALDSHFTTLIPDAVKCYPSGLCSTEVHLESEEVRVAKDIIRRLPNLPKRIFRFPLSNASSSQVTYKMFDGLKDTSWVSKFIVPEARHLFKSQDLDGTMSSMDLISEGIRLQDLSWANFYVTTFIDTNSIALAIKIAQQQGNANFEFAQQFQEYIDLLAQLIDDFEDLDFAARLLMTGPFSDPAPSVQALRRMLFPEVDEYHKQGRAIIRAFLWTSWQRAMMLYFYYLLQVQIRQKAPPEWSSLFAVQGVERLSELDSYEYRGEGIDYLCNWAFQILRTSRSSLSLDFRTILSRFDSHFPGFSGRCNKNSGLTCQGDVPESCGRFTGAETKSQSMHGLYCDGFCAKIAWSEESYRRLNGARAVSSDTSHSYLEYCQVSSRTMAISHVWSHGQGGRPEQGINLCLHEQYMALAKACGCESYWIDSTCIPSDAMLRKEAIGTINRVFTESGVVMIIDKDLQTIDLSSPPIETLETLLSILLVCDWNVRAWTMLEAIRGRRNVHLLCKNGKVMSMIDLFHKILDEGAIDLAVLLGSAQHLLPYSDATAKLSIEDAGFLLSQRHASRPSDEVVIWGLLNNLPGDQSAFNLWKSQTRVRTGFLMSSASRLTSEKYRWAPKVPYIRPQLRTVSLGNSIHFSAQKQHYTVCYQPYDAQGSYVAQIEARGLKGKWLIQDMNTDVLAQYRIDFCMKTGLESGHPTQQELNPHLDPMTEVYQQPDTASACNEIERLLGEFRQVRVVRPLDEYGTVPYKGGRRRGEIYGMNAAVCASSPGCESWEWQGVYQWLDESEDLYWRIESMIIE